ncbi:hypothetical protein A2917_00265 [Candidatus Nomurabacteria bacterium RIFCSPLOWO2_01_FULL_42_17]|uniref:Uncharacterized protein n=1 Tax=Candidatus Nomurabacteria bacterium RIFCSPLOWO2_01_FULL_42_17 TaxID=1801780 RepID=A0A1F6XNV2_9BACT|nr:MAG: hypothetical protein A2917_00265 [Candidatus Nomurabacteria bacterium RIFCSPLOWO2_01_FULL_42_17]
MENIKVIVSIFAILLTCVAYIPYIRDTRKGKTTPHAFTWFVWGLSTTLAFALQLSAGGGIGSYVTLIIGVAAFSIFGLSLFKGEKHITKSDVVFFILALVALGFWVIAEKPIISVILISLTNTLAFAPTVRKSWKKPFSETLFTYILNCTRQCLNLLALENYNLITSLFPASQILVTLSFIIFILIRRSLQKKEIQNTTRY